MKLWLISQRVNNGYDTFDSAVVAAPDDLAARLIHPYGDDTEPEVGGEAWPSWAPIRHVEVKLIGTSKTAKAGDVICASFNAG